MEPSTDFTHLLVRARAGDAGARGEVFATVYEELRRVAHELEPRGAGRTLQPTAVVHEAWFKLAPKLDGVNGRLHFIAVASIAMRQVLADYSRERRRDKRGGAWSAVTLGEDSAQSPPLDADALTLSEHLEHLAGFNERHARVVELRVFGGLTIAETAQALELPLTTIEWDWRMARAWLWRRLAPTV